MSTFLDNLKFSNRFVEQLPANPVTDNYCRQVESAYLSYVEPTQVSPPPQTLATFSEILETISDD
ncbi:hypothetical protein [Aliamphritea spongicola]|uniref:hypothetical protein n=1 Tax=Aliamphritea spongicola TaxID=707589 RepID=UPI00196B4198|nr:hypothetical protein [Aliamphritea spongicola]MBN3563101.1 hypothetical protein [Aliamphritea spongicola]